MEGYADTVPSAYPVSGGASVVLFFCGDKIQKMELKKIVSMNKIGRGY